MRDRTKPAGPSAIVLALILTMVAASCGGGDDGGVAGTLDPADAQKDLSECVDDIVYTEDIVDWRANVTPGATGDLAEALPPIDEYPIVVTGRGDVVVEVFASTEKSGTGTDGWIVEAAEAFNNSGATLPDGRSVGVTIRKIASGLGYQYIGSGEYLPDGFTPSNHLWIEMAAARQVNMTPIREQLVPNVAGVVMKTDTAATLEEKYGTLDAATIINAVVAGDMTMGYTDPFASSTGLNFLVSTLDSFASGDENRFLAPDVVSTFESFQRNVPFVALTTLQIRESVEAGGSLDAFVMEWQTYTNTDTLGSGYRFIPFGIAHNNPLYAVGDLDASKLEALEAFAAFAGGSEYQQKAADYGFDPDPYTPTITLPSGGTLIAAQQLWKEKKDGGRPVVAVFVADVSGSMEGSRIMALKRALQSGMEFITPENHVGLIEFDTQVRLVLPIAEFDLNQKALFAAAVQDMDAGGGTAMYDGICLGLQMLVDQTQTIPDAKPMLFVLTDGETSEGHTFGEVDDIIQSINFPVYTVGFEADIAELGRLSALVEAATLNASEEDIEFRIGSMFNAEL
jgi:Ca-activated chloride channel family protein